MATLATAGGCQAFRGGTSYSTDPPAIEHALPSTDRPMPTGLVGDVPLPLVLLALEVSRYPDDPDLPSISVRVDPSFNKRDLIFQTEVETGWVYDAGTNSFVRFYATSTLDGPDAFGRPSRRSVPLDARPSARLSVRLVNLGIATAFDAGKLAPVDLSVSLQEIAVSVPDGVFSTWSSTENRTYREGAVQPIGNSPVVETTLKTRSAGIQLSALCARLPGGKARIDGTVTISSFTTGLDTADVTVPLQLDIPRGSWIRIYRTRTVGASATILLRAFGATAAAGQVALEVRVD